MAAAPQSHTAPAAFRVEVKLDDRARACRSMDELLTFLRELSGGLGAMLIEHRARALAIRDAKIRLGKALLQVRGQVQHGTWERVLSGLGINRKTAEAAVRIAERFADDRGAIDTGKVAEAQARKSAEPGMERIAAKPPAEVSIRDLTALASEPRNTPTESGNFGLRASHLSTVGDPAGEWDVGDEDDEIDDDEEQAAQAASSAEVAEALPGLPPDAVARGGVHRADDAAPPAPRPAAEEVGGRHEQLTFASVYESVAALGRTQDRVMDLIRGGRSDLAAECERLAREHDERLKELLARSEAA